VTFKTRISYLIGYLEGRWGLMSRLRSRFRARWESEVSPLKAPREVRSSGAYQLPKVLSMDEPLIHTTLGNVPVASLTHEVAWRVTSDIVHFQERYLAADGTVVRQDVHVYAFGADAQSDSSI